MNLNKAMLGTIPEAKENFRSGFIAIVGRPNVGKSTLMNHLIGQKIAITSPVAQTTRNRLRGILTNENAQIIFVDTPGIHKPHHQLGKILFKNAIASFDSVDLVLMVVDCSVKAGGGDRYIAELLTSSSTPVILGLNKADQQKDEQIDQSYHDLAQQYSWPYLKFSALDGTGTLELQQRFLEALPNGPYYYPPDLVTDQPERFIMGELIREQILHLTQQEIPHSVAVVIEKVEETPKLTRVMAAINVERQSQKGIIIGAKGSMLRNIGQSAREQIQKLIDGDVYLELFVKVEPKWRQSRMLLAELGYREEN